MKGLAVNKMMVGGEMLGYRVEYIEGGRIIASLDMKEDVCRYFLEKVGQVNIRKGVEVFGEVVKGSFVTDLDINVIKVTTKDDVEEVLEKYFYNKPDKIDYLLNW